MEVALDVGQPGLQRRRIELGRGLVLEAEQLGATGEGHGAAGGDHRLRGDAVPQVGGTTDDVALDEGNVRSKAGSVGRGRVAGRSPADDDEANRHDFEANPA